MAISQGFRQNRRLEYDPKGGDFLQEQRLTLLARPLPYLCGNKRRLCRVQWVKGEKEYRKRNGGLCKWYTYRSARSRNPEDGAPTPATYVPVHVLPCTGAKITNREATPSYLFTRKIRGSRRPVPCHSHRIWQDAANCGFFAPPHPLRQLSRSQRSGNAPFLRLSRR